MVFTCSYSDWFIEEADPWRDEAWETVKQTPHLTYQILTKRPERIQECLPRDWREGYGNVWLGVTVEDERARWRIGELLGVSAALYFVSHEPLLEPIDMSRHIQGVDWGIIGGESGRGARAMHIQWAQSLIQQYQEANVPVFVKQMGSWMARANPRMKDWKGAELTEWHPSVRVREMP